MATNSAPGNNTHQLSSKTLFHLSYKIFYADDISYICYYIEVNRRHNLSFWHKITDFWGVFYRRAKLLL